LKKVVAVDDALKPLEKRLKQEGYNTVKLQEADYDHVGAIIVNSIDDNFMNMQDTMTKAPVIEASGRSPEEIVKELRRRNI